MELVERKLKIVFYFHLNKNICIGQVQFFFVKHKMDFYKIWKTIYIWCFRLFKVKQKKRKSDTKLIKIWVQTSVALRYYIQIYAILSISGKSVGGSLVRLHRQWHDETYWHVPTARTQQDPGLSVISPTDTPGLRCPYSSHLTNQLSSAHISSPK